ncbi:MAG TPA: thioesterase family protein [Candidatus Nitrosocosmicus sp.]|nr:thioesterase family protein [Candidatus Nitrosocosmicus sp.]
MKIHETILRTRYGETDQMGIIYHPNYYIYFEMGRTEFLREAAGMSYKELEDTGIMLPLTETHCKYRIPAKYDDELIVRTSIKELTVARIAFEYQLLRNVDGAILAVGETVHAFTNKQGRPVNLKKANQGLFETFISLSENGDQPVV